MNSVEDKIILIDGECVVCNRFVQFIKARDDGVFVFGSQSSDKGREILKKHGLEPGESVTLVKEESIYTESDAVIEISSELTAPWSYLKYTILVPEFLRDYFYRFFSKYRHKISGKVPEPDTDYNQERMI